MNVGTKRSVGGLALAIVAMILTWWLQGDPSSSDYREYTVLTPGSDDRGARRIVAGSNGEYYYTYDHYNSFERIAR
jgi:guanyl-specific ribonuclease Sa